MVQKKTILTETREHFIGKYAYQVTDNLTPYLYPQECGNRTHVRKLSIIGENKKLEVEGKDFEFTALHYTPYELENARHKDELPNVYKSFYASMKNKWVLLVMIHGVLRHMMNSY